MSEITRISQLKNYRTLIISIVTYGSELVGSERNEEDLKNFEQKIVRKIFGQVQKRGGSRCVIRLSLIHI